MYEIQCNFKVFKQDIKIFSKLNMLVHVVVHVFLNYHLRKPIIK